MPPCVVRDSNYMMVQVIWCSVTATVGPKSPNFSKQFLINVIGAFREHIKNVLYHMFGFAMSLVLVYQAVCQD